jgi:post-segregation antitoxin (ccd killing protein)
MTNVTIRGIDDQTYLKFSAQATLEGVPIGELTTRAMQAYLEKDQGKVYRIGNMEDIAINRNDLESLDGAVVLQNIERLTLMDDLDWPLVNEHIRSIDNVETLVLPKGISKFQMLTKARNVEDIRTV